jgi:predicted amidophosphoribosyltransferase
MRAVEYQPTDEDQVCPGCGGEAEVPGDYCWDCQADRDGDDMGARER